MKSNNVIFAVLVAAMPPLAGCFSGYENDYLEVKVKVNPENHIVPAERLPPNVKVTSMVPFNKESCGGYGSSSEQGFDTGFKIVLKDKNANIIAGHGWIGSSGSATNFSSSNEPTCENTNAKKAKISAYASGFVPVEFEIGIVENKILTIEIVMPKSGTIESKCSDINYLKEQVKQDFNLEGSDYTLDYSECDIDRGGYIKAMGKYSDGNPMVLYYHWGWCSSGGADCGWKMCMSTQSKKLMELEKNLFCNKLVSGVAADEGFCPGPAVDDSQLVKNSCLNGDFQSGNSFSIIQNGSECSFSVKVGNMDCMDN